MAALGAAEYTELITSTLQNIEEDPADQVLLRHPTLDIFRENSMSETGRTLVYNIEAAEDTSTQFTDASGSFDTTKSPDIYGAAEYQWAQPLVSSVRIEYKKLQKNMGRQQIIDLLQGHIEAAQKGHAKKIAEQLHVRYDQGVPANVGTDTGPFHSLDAICGDATYDANPAGDGTQPEFTVGGIDAGGDTTHFWQAQRIEIPVDSTNFSNIAQVFRHVENEIIVNTSNDAETTHIIAGRDVFTEYQDFFDDKLRVLEFDQAQSRFRGYWWGNIQLRLDPDCPPKRAYFLDMNKMRFRYLNGNFMQTMDRQPIPGTLDFVVPLASIMAVGTNMRRNHAVLLRPDTAGGDA